MLITRIVYEIKTTIFKGVLCVCVWLCVYVCVLTCLHASYIFEDVYCKLRFTKDMRGIMLKEVLSYWFFLVASNIIVFHQ